MCVGEKCLCVILPGCVPPPPNGCSHYRALFWQHFADLWRQLPLPFGDKDKWADQPVCSLHHHSRSRQSVVLPVGLFIHTDRSYRCPLWQEINCCNLVLFGVVTIKTLCPPAAPLIGVGRRRAVRGPRSAGPLKRTGWRRTGTERLTYNWASCCFSYPSRWGFSPAELCSVCIFSTGQSWWDFLYSCAPSRKFPN